jgi:hypothetical protein
VNGTLATREPSGWYECWCWGPDSLLWPKKIGKSGAPPSRRKGSISGNNLFPWSYVSNDFCTPLQPCSSKKKFTCFVSEHRSSRTRSCHRREHHPIRRINGGSPRRGGSPTLSEVRNCPEPLQWMVSANFPSRALHFVRLRLYICRGVRNAAYHA